MTAPADAAAARPLVLVLGPSRSAVSGVATHLNMLWASALAQRFELQQFQVGSEGRDESAALRAWRLLSSPVALAARLLRRRPALLHINTSIDPKAFWRDLAYLAVARWLGCPVLYQLHGGDLPATFAARGAWQGRALRWALRTAGRVVVLSQQELAAYRPLCPPGRLLLIANAIDAAALVQAPRTANPNAALRLVYVGRLVRAKGLFEVLQALARLKADGLALGLRIAGSGPDRAALQAQVEQHGLQDEVSFLGSVFGADKDKLWLASDVFVFPTCHAEGLPYAVLEAMAAGCLTLATPVGAIADVITDGQHGLLVPAPDVAALALALRRIHQDRSLLDRLGQAARQRVEQGYSLARLANDFSAAYAQCVEDR